MRARSGSVPRLRKLPMEEAEGGHLAEHQAVSMPSEDGT